MAPRNRAGNGSAAGQRRTQQFVTIMTRYLLVRHVVPYIPLCFAVCLFHGYARMPVRKLPSRFIFLLCVFVGADSVCSGRQRLICTGYCIISRGNHVCASSLRLKTVSFSSHGLNKGDYSIIPALKTHNERWYITTENHRKYMISTRSYKLA